eukprot:gene16573-22805_t
MEGAFSMLALKDLRFAAARPGEKASSEAVVFTKLAVSASSLGAGSRPGAILAYPISSNLNDLPSQGEQESRTHRGLVLFGPGQMPYQSDKWQCFQHLKLTSTLGFFAATHGCSYACAFSSFVNVTKNVCLLSSEGADLSVASYCPSFPVMFSSSCMPYLTEP